MFIPKTVGNLFLAIADPNKKGLQRMLTIQFTETLKKPSHFFQTCKMK